MTGSHDTLKVTTGTRHTRHMTHTSTGTDCERRSVLFSKQAPYARAAPYDCLSTTAWSSSRRAKRFRFCRANRARLRDVPSVPPAVCGLT